MEGSRKGRREDRGERRGGREGERTRDETRWNKEKEEMKAKRGKDKIRWKYTVERGGGQLY